MIHETDLPQLEDGVSLEVHSYTRAKKFVGI